MVKNMSKTDGTVRVVLAVIIALLGYFEVITGVWLVVSAAVALIFLATGFINFCPLYMALGIKTRKKS